MLALILTLAVLVVWAIARHKTIPIFQSGVLTIGGVPINYVVGSGWKPALPPFIDWKLVDTRKGGKIAIALKDLLAPYIQPTPGMDLIDMEPVNLEGDITAEFHVGDPYLYLSQRDPEGLFKDAVHAILRKGFLNKRIVDCLRPDHQQDVIDTAMGKNPRVQGEIPAAAARYGLVCGKVFLTRIEPEDPDLERIWESRNRERAQQAGEAVQAQTDINKARMYAAAEVGLHYSGRESDWATFEVKITDKAAFNRSVMSWLERIQQLRIQQISAEKGRMINVSSDVVRAIRG